MVDPHVFPLDHVSTTPKIAVSLVKFSIYWAVVVGFACPKCGLVFLPDDDSTSSACGCFEDVKPVIQQGTDCFTYEEVYICQEDNGNMVWVVPERVMTASEWLSGFFLENGV